MNPTPTGLFSCCVVAIVLAGCSTSTGQESGGADPRVGKEVALPTGSIDVPADALRETGKITICTSADNPPFEFKAKNSTVVGFDVDLAKGLAAAMKVEPVFKEAEFAQLDTGKTLENSSCDAIVAALTVTTARSQKMLFSDSYFDAHQVIVTKTKSKVASSETFKGKKLGVQLGTTGELLAKDKYPDAEFVSFQSLGQLIHAVEQGKVDAFINDLGPAANAAFNNKAIKVVHQIPTGEKYAVAVAPANTALQGAINSALAAVESSGTLAAIHTKWFGEGTVTS